MTYLAWLAERFRDIFSRAPGHRYMPYERTVAIWAWNLRLVFVLVPAFALGWWWQAVAWEPCKDALRSMHILFAWSAYTIWGAGWLGGFAWADLGPGEWFVKSLTHRPSCPKGNPATPWGIPVTVTGLTWACCGGTSYVPNILNTTLEGYEGPKENHQLLVASWLRLRYAVLRPFDGDPGSGRFGDE